MLKVVSIKPKSAILIPNRRSVAAENIAIVITILLSTLAVTLRSREPVLNSAAAAGY